MYLNCHTRFSFHYGTLSVEELLGEAKRCGIRKLVLTDINNTSAVLDFIRLAPKFDVEPVVGIEFRNGHTLCFIGIAANNEGFGELNRFLSDCLAQGAHYGESSGNRDAVVPERAPEFHNVRVIYPMEKVARSNAEEATARSLVLSMQRRALSAGDSREEEKKRQSEKRNFSLRENEFIGVGPDDLARLPFSPYRKMLHRCVVLWPVTIRNKMDFNVHRLLCAIGHNTLLSKLSPEVVASPGEVMLPEADIRERYAQFQQLLINTEHLLEQSSISFVFNESKNKKNFTSNNTKDFELLRAETEKGLSYRYGNRMNAIIRDRAEKELRMIRDYGFSSYFLINWDIVCYAQHKNYFYVGRGSGANSIVAYALRITDVDPIELDLYFERFINPYRKNPPDFDLDFSWKDRDDITAHIFKRHGTEHVALLATYSTYQRKAVVRELGKVFGLPKEEIDGLFDYNKKFQSNDHITGLIERYSVRLHDFPHHLSVHAGGILVSEEPITCYTALNHPPKGYPLTQFSMVEAEDIGLYKFDILSQRGLGHIRDTVDIVKENHDITIDIHAIAEFKQDEKIKALIRNGRCIGCFYVESPGMRMLLKKLQVDSYIQLVAASSIIRPGVSSSGMMREYILRTHDPSRRTYIHPVMKELMEETYGIMVYQEDVIKVAHHFAGLDLSEADVLRRGMSGKFRSREEFQKIKDRFFDNCREKGYEEKITTEVWRQIESFAGYSFSKGHSASYAVESYQSLYLKAHYPLEFMVGVINNFGGFYNTEFYVHEARMSGAKVLPPDINESEYVTCIKGKDIYLGFIHMSTFEKGVSGRIISERQRNGAYRSLKDFMDRVSIEIELLRILIRVGAFRFTGRSKKQLLWDIHAHLGHARKTEVRKELFEVSTPRFELPELHHHTLDDAFDELEILGFPLITPFAMLKKELLKRPSFLASDLDAFRGKDIEITGYLVTVKPTRTAKGDRMAFGCFIDHKGCFFDTTHFPKVIQDFPFRGRGCYTVRGKVEEEFGFCSITVRHMEKLQTVGIDDLATV
jgi:error-prone DNA polymerase